MTNIDPAIVDALADALHADTDICGGGCTQTAKRLAPALGPAVADATNEAVEAAVKRHVVQLLREKTAALAELDAARAEVARLRAAVADALAHGWTDYEAATEVVAADRLDAALAATEDQP